MGVEGRTVRVSIMSVIRSVNSSDCSSFDSDDSLLMMLCVDWEAAIVLVSEY